MKKMPALIAAVVTTLVVGCLMAFVAVNALLNPNTVQAANTPDQAQQAQPVQSVATSGDPAAQVQQLQNLVSQYQQREKQYQSQLDQARQRLQQANSQIQQANQQAQQATQAAQTYQNILGQLQQMGVIQVDSNGQISVPRFRGSEGRGFGDGD